MITDPNGMWKDEGDGNWTAQKGDSPGSLAKDANIFQSEAEDVMRNYNKNLIENEGKKRSSDIMVYEGDQVTVGGSGSSESSVTSTDSDLNSQLQGVKLAPIPENYSSGEISEYIPTFVDNWSESDNFLASITYGIVDDAWVYGTSLVFGPGKMRHLTGVGANRNELTRCGINTITNFVPIGKMGKAIGIGKKTLNIAEYSSHYVGTDVLRGFSPAQRGFNLRMRNYLVQQDNYFIRVLPTTMWSVSILGEETE